MMMSKKSGPAKSLSREMCQLGLIDGMHDLTKYSDLIYLMFGSIKHPKIKLTDGKIVDEYYTSQLLKCTKHPILRVEIMSQAELLQFAHTYVELQIGMLCGLYKKRKTLKKCLIYKKNLIINKRICIGVDETKIHGKRKKIYKFALKKIAKSIGEQFDTYNSAVGQNILRLKCLKDDAIILKEKYANMYWMECEDSVNKYLNSLFKSKQRDTFVDIYFVIPDAVIEKLQADEKKQNYNKGVN